MSRSRTCVACKNPRRIWNTSVLCRCVFKSFVIAAAQHVRSTIPRRGPSLPQAPMPALLILDKRMEKVTSNAAGSLATSSPSSLRALQHARSQRRRPLRRRSPARRHSRPALWPSHGRRAFSDVRAPPASKPFENVCGKRLFVELMVFCRMASYPRSQPESTSRSTTAPAHPACARLTRAVESSSREDLALRDPRPASRGHFGGEIEKGE